MAICPQHRHQTQAAHSPRLAARTLKIIHALRTSHPPGLRPIFSDRAYHTSVASQISAAGFFAQQLRPPCSPHVILTVTGVQEPSDFFGSALSRHVIKSEENWSTIGRLKYHANRLCVKESFYLRRSKFVVCVHHFIAESFVVRKYWLSLSINYQRIGV
jgi:hypothetical protein